MSAASRPPAKGLQYCSPDGGKRHGMAGTKMTESDMAWHGGMAWQHSMAGSQMHTAESKVTGS